MPAALAAAPATALAARRQSLPFNIPAEADMRRRQVSPSPVLSTDPTYSDLCSRCRACLHSTGPSWAG